MSDCFNLSSEVVLRFEPQYYQTYIAFNFRKVKTQLLNINEFKILEYISNKSASLSEISKKTEINFEDCSRFLKKMLNSGFIKKNDKLLQLTNIRRTLVDSQFYNNFSTPFLSSPVSVDLFITNNCNLKCVHCFSKKASLKPSFLTFNILDSLFNQFEDLRILELRINGGEPLLHPDILKILENLGSRRFRKVLLTNGTLLNEKIIKILKISEITPTISLDDSIPEGHDLFRGIDGTFKKTKKALKLLQKHNVQYGINCCLHNKNLNRFKDIITFVSNLGASRIAFLDLKLVGNMKNNSNWIPSYEEYQKTKFKLFLEKIVPRNIDVSLDVFLTCNPLKESIFEAKKGYVTCQAGKSRLSINSDGSVYPCNLVLSDSNWNMGNIKKEKLKDVWFSDKWKFFRGNVKIKDLHQCKTCKKLKNCEDFYCRLLPYVENKDPYGPHLKCL